jgi:hypothetical protein
MGPSISRTRAPPKPNVRGLSAIDLVYQVFQTENPRVNCSDDWAEFRRRLDAHQEFREGIATWLVPKGTPESEKRLKKATDVKQMMNELPQDNRRKLKFAELHRLCDAQMMHRQTKPAGK